LRVVFSKLLETALDRHNIRLKKFRDIVSTSHAREVPWFHASGQPRAISIVLDAQGAMLVLRRVRDLAQKGVLEEGCAERARKIARTLKDFGENKLGDMSLVGFDVKARLAEMEKKHDAEAVKERGKRVSWTANKAKTSGGASHMSDGEEGCDARQPRQARLSRGRTRRFHVDGLDGLNHISRLADGDKLQVLLK